MTDQVLLAQALQIIEARRARMPAEPAITNPLAAVAKTVEAAAQARKEEKTGHEDDYIGPDGLLMCPRCHTPTQTVNEVPDWIDPSGYRTVFCACACEIARREEEERRRRAMEEMERIKQLRKVGISDKGYLSMTFANDRGFDPEMTAIAARYVEKHRQAYANNMGLLLHGSVGGGKTYWAAAIVNALIDRGVSAMITTIPQLITAMARDFERDKAAILDQIANVRFLVLDDIGFERRTTYAAEKMFEIIDTRARARRPLIVTTNLTMEQLKRPEDMDYKRVFDRIIEMCSTPIFVSGEGRRTALAREKNIIARDILEM